jgi:hypothetical protein
VKDSLDFAKAVLEVLSIPLTPWLLFVLLAVFMLRDRLKRIWDGLLDRLGAVTNGEWSYRRFDPRFRAVLFDEHHLLKLVGLRIEHVRRPHILDAYVPITLVREGASLDSAQRLDDIIRERGYCVVLGDPGAGKSTILDHLIVTATSAPGRSGPLHTLRRYVLPFRAAHGERLPIYVPLRRCRESNATLLADIVDPETKILSAAATNQMPPDFIERSLKKGRALLLLDGLDEVKDLDAHKSVAKKINDVRLIYPSTRIVVTCRRAGWQGLLQGFETYTALGLDARQQYDFVHRWYRAIYRHKGFDRPLSDDERARRASREADSLLNLLRTKERLREIAGNPLLLSLISLVYSRTKALPRGRTGLYQECITILLDYWDQIDKDFDLDDDFPSREQKKMLLRRIAYRMHTRGIREIDRTSLEGLVREFLPAAGDGAAEIVSKIEVRSGLMSERSIDVLAFSHLTFQEYLIVEYLLEEPDAELDLGAITDWNAWREPLLLYSGVKARAHLLVQAIYETHPLIALDAIPELSPSLLPDVGPIVVRALEDVATGRIDFAAAVPSLVGLLSLEGGRFTNDVMNFMSGQAPADMPDRRALVIESVSRIPTREAARTILWLSRGQALDTVSTTALARIGDPALYECLEAADRSEISERDLLTVFNACSTIAATQMLLRRYKFDPPHGLDLEWAIAWGRRLSFGGDGLLEGVITIPPLPVDADAWPYAGSLKAAPILLSRVVGILRRRYREIEDLVANADVFRELNDRVQLPILVGMRSVRRAAVPYLNWLAPRYSMLYYTLRWRSTRFGFDPNSLGFDLSSLGLLDEHSWRTLGGFLRRNSGTGQLRLVCSWAGCALLGIVLVASVVSMRALLPPDGTFVGFLRVVPWWGYAVAALLIASPAGFYLASWIRGEHSDSELLIVAPIAVAIGLAVLVTAPGVYLIATVVGASVIPTERSLSTRRIPWVVLIAIGGTSIAVGWLCGVAMRAWVVPWVGVLAASAATAAGIVLAVHALAFRHNGVVTFVGDTGIGGDVLRSFADVTGADVSRYVRFRRLVIPGSMGIRPGAAAERPIAPADARKPEAV